MSKPIERTQAGRVIAYTTKPEACRHAGSKTLIPEGEDACDDCGKCLMEDAAVAPFAIEQPETVTIAKMTREEWDKLRHANMSLEAWALRNSLIKPEPTLDDAPPATEKLKDAVRISREVIQPDTIIIARMTENEVMDAHLNADMPQSTQKAIIATFQTLGLIKPEPTLAERIEAATGPCRELDAEIALKLGIVVKRLKRGEWLYVDGSSNGLAPYTSSIDAAMRLMPADGVISLDWNGGTWTAKVSIDGDCFADFEYVMSINSHAPLALCAAALRARDVG